MIDKTSWISVYPEIILFVMACVIAMVDLEVKSARRTFTYILTLATLALVAAMQAAYAAHPERFVNGAPVLPPLPAAVWLNPPRQVGVPIPAAASGDVNDGILAAPVQEDKALRERNLSSCR